MDQPRWLDDDEQRAWRRLAAVILKLPSELEAQLQRDSGMSHFDYWVIALLSEAPDRTLRLSHLAAQPTHPCHACPTLHPASRSAAGSSAVTAPTMLAPPSLC